MAAFACAAERPVLYPNDQLRSVGREVAEREIDECIEEASKTREELSQPAKAALALAATAAYLAAGAYSETNDTGPVDEDGRGDWWRCTAEGCTAEDYREAVDTCLRAKGYRPVIWKR